MTNPIWFWIWCILAVVFLGICASIMKRLSERRAAQRDLEDQRTMEMIEAEIEVGTRLPDGRKACCICGHREATHRLPVIGLSMFERLNPLRDLYGSLHLYRRVEDGFSEPTVCATHRDLYASFLDAELSELRRLAASFASNIDRRISDLRSGVLLEGVKEYALADKKLPRVTFSAPNSPLLTAGDEMAVSAPQTTNGKRVDEHAEVAN